MNFQEITTYIIIFAAFSYSIISLINIFKKDNENSNICSSCPYSKNGACSKNLNKEIDRRKTVSFSQYR